MLHQVMIDDLYRYRNAYPLALSAAMGAMFVGWDTGLIGGILSLPSFRQYFAIDLLSTNAQANLNGNIVSVLQAGCFFGAISTGYTSGHFGRKKPLVTAGLIYLIGSIVQIVCGLGTSRAVGLRVLYFGRFLSGFSLGMITALVPSYLSECTPKEIRGRCTCLIQVMGTTGTMLSFWINYGASLHIPFGQMQWRMPFTLQLVPGVLFVLSMLPQPESPRWLVEQQRYDEAAKSLAYATGSSINDEAVVTILEEIKADLTGKQMMSVWREFRGMGESRITVFIPSLVMLFQQWSGTNSINYFSPEIFADLGVTGTNSGLFATGVYGVVKLLAVTATAIFAVEKMGRKRCLFIGGMGQALLMFWIGGFTALHPQRTIVPASYVSIIAVYLYVVFFSIGWGPIPWVIIGEVAPNHMRSVAVSLAIGTNWLFAFTISRATPNLLEEIGYGTFLLFGMWCVVMTAWTYFCLPETKGYALEDIRYLFGKDMIVRALEDAPGGRIFLGGRRSTPVANLRRATRESNVTVESDEKGTEIASRRQIP